MTSLLSLFLLALQPGVYFTVEVEQGGRLLPVSEDRVVLARKPFTLVFRMREPQIVLVHASHDPKTQKAAKAGKPVDSIPGLQGTGAAEDDGNPKRGMFLLENGFNAWYYDDPDRHRFDGPCKREGNELVCRRTIENLWFDGRKSVPVTQFAGRAIHLVAMRAKWKPDYSGKTVLQLTCLSLLFPGGTS